MDVIVTMQDNTVIDWVPSVEAAQHRTPFPGGAEHRASGSFGTLIFHEQAGDDFSIWRKQFTLKQHSTLNFTSPQDELRFLLAYDLPFSYQQSGMGEFTLPEGQFTILYSPAGDYQLYFNKGKHYTLYEIRFSLLRLQSLVQGYRWLPAFILKTASGLPALLNTVPAQVTPRMILLLRDMLHCELTGHARLAYLEALFSQLLLQGIGRLGTGHTVSRELRLQPYELNKLREAWDYLLHNLDQVGTVAEVALEVGLNEFKLKRGFKQVYGLTIFEFLLEARMEKAKRLLEETNMTVHAVGIAVGYKNISSFSVAFKKKFNVLPSEARGKGGNNRNY